MPATIAAGYNRRSLQALACLVAVYTAVGVNWFHLLDLSRGMDWLLGGIWAFMTAALCWDVRPRRDLPLTIVAMLGGLVIEGWGTQTRLWTYFTLERPPIWIIPAWPVAGLTVDRLARVLDAALPRGAADRVPWRLAYWTLVPLFVLAMTRFLWPTVDLGASQLVVGLMLVVLASSTNARADMVLFLAGTGLGIFLEYWGTSRRCWTYYTHAVPPPVAVVAHGFASLAFARGVTLWSRLRGVGRPGLAT
ncbi:MAG: hypothetical protein D6798_19895 [Deltaproteobacteria bacterium]|nr:MAG: hypothetical protein D6798_19895 [Deltaproteobacteria bacterium]